MSSKRTAGGEVTSSTSKRRCVTKPIERMWQAHLKDPVDRLTAIYNNSRLSDLTISFPGRHEKLKVHRLVLAMTSPVFECMFYGPLAEGEELKLPEDPPEAFKLLLGYMYTGLIDLPCVSTAVEVYRLASKYQIDALSLICSQFLQENLDGKNFPLIYETASVLEDKDLLSECGLVMTFAAESVLSSPLIGLLSRHYMKRFLKRKLSVCSEVSVFKGLIKWSSAQESQAKAKGRFTEPEEIRKIIDEFLPFVKFLSMTMEEFVKHVVPSKILTSDESLAILMNISDVEDIPLPQLCSQEGRRCFLSLDKVHTVSVSKRKCSYYGIGEVFDGVLCKELISGLKVTRDICLGSIALRFKSPRKLGEWRIEVADYSGSVVGKAKYGDAQKEPSGNDIYSQKINVIFSPPILLRSKKLHNIWLHCRSQNRPPETFRVQYDTFHFKGYIWYDARIKFKFWYFKGSSKIEKLTNEESSDEERHEYEEHHDYSEEHHGYLDKDSDDSEW